MKKSFVESINKYLQAFKNSEWILDEEYKFVCANYVNKNVNWESQTNNEIFKILINSQEHIAYRNSVRKFKGVQFLQDPARRGGTNDYLNVSDIELFREVREGKNIDTIDWSNRTKGLTFPLLSAWLSFLFPDEIYPATLPATKTKVHFDEIIRFLFSEEIQHKKGLKSILERQSFMKETEEMLRQYPIEKHLLETWNDFYISNPKLNIEPKQELDKVDWIWLTQDFYLFVQREILDPNYQLNSSDAKVPEYSEIENEEVTEGSKRLVIHKEYERNQSLIRKIKQKAFQENKMLNCEVCGFSFLDTYGEIGVGFIEAHHTNPLSERERERVTKAEDIVLVCSNCHRMLHKGNPVYSLEKLKEKMSKRI